MTYARQKMSAIRLFPFLGVTAAVTLQTFSTQPRARKRAARVLAEEISAYLRADCVQAPEEVPQDGGVGE